MSSPALDLRQHLRRAAFTSVPGCFAEACDARPVVNCARHKALAIQAELERLTTIEETVLGQLESAREAALAAGHDADALGPLFVERTSAVRETTAARREALEAAAVTADAALEGALAAYASLLEAAESLDDDALASCVEALLKIDSASRAAVAAIPAAPTTSSYLALALPSADPETLRLCSPEAVFGALLVTPILADHVHTPHCGPLCSERFAPHVHSAACNHMQGPAGAVFAAAASGDTLSLEADLRSGGSTEEVGMIDEVGGEATAIAAASARGSLEAVQMLLAAGADPGSISLPGGWVCGSLHAAAFAGHDAIVGRLLADPRVDPNALAVQDGISATPLIAALVHRHVAVVQALLADPRTDLDAISDGVSALHLAANVGLDVMVRLLLADSSGRLDVNARAAHGVTALHMAVSKGHVEVAIALLGDPRTDVAAAADNGITALYIAAEKGLDAIVRLLLVDPHGRLNVNARHTDGCTALHAAAHFGHVEVVSALLADHRTDVGAVADHGVTVLHIAAQAGAEAVTRLLLDSPRLSDVNGRAGDLCVAPLHAAVESGSLGIVRALLQDPRVDTNARREGGLTPLHIAVLKADCACVRLLLDDARVDVNARDTVPGGEWAPVFWARNAARIDRQLVSLFLGHPRVLLTSAERRKIEAALPLEGEEDEPQGSWRCLIQ